MRTCAYMVLTREIGYREEREREREADHDDDEITRRGFFSSGRRAFKREYVIMTSY